SHHPYLTSFPYTTLFRSDMNRLPGYIACIITGQIHICWSEFSWFPGSFHWGVSTKDTYFLCIKSRWNERCPNWTRGYSIHTNSRSEEHTSELQSRFDLVC